MELDVKKLSLLFSKTATNFSYPTSDVRKIVLLWSSSSTNIEDILYEEVRILFIVARRKVLGIFFLFRHDEQNSYAAYDGAANHGIKRRRGRGRQQHSTKTSILYKTERTYMNLKKKWNKGWGKDASFYFWTTATKTKLLGTKVSKNFSTLKKKYIKTATYVCITRKFSFPNSLIRKPFFDSLPFST